MTESPNLLSMITLSLGTHVFFGLARSLRSSTHHKSQTQKEASTQSSLPLHFHKLLRYFRYFLAFAAHHQRHHQPLVHCQTSYDDHVRIHGIHDDSAPRTISIPAFPAILQSATPLTVR